MRAKKRKAIRPSILGSMNSATILGNVLAVISDKVNLYGHDNRLDSARATVVSASDYYPFGLVMKGRTFDSASYRFGFGGHEKDVEGGVQNAIRHTLWQALLTRDVGAKAASRIGNVHETTTNVDLNQRVFKNETDEHDADRTIDLLNNQIGRSIGEQNKDADNITTAKSVITEYYKNGLYTMAGNKTDGYKIQKTKLTKSQYETAMKEIDKKGQDGKNKTTDEK